MKSSITALLSIFLILFGFNSFSQNSKIKWGLYGKKTVEERRATFPFSNAKKVLLIAFPNPINSIVEVDGVLITNDSLKLINMHFNIIKSFELPERKSKYYVFRGWITPEALSCVLRCCWGFWTVKLWHAHCDVGDFDAAGGAPRFRIALIQCHLKDRPKLNIFI